MNTVLDLLIVVAVVLVSVGTGLIAGVGAALVAAGVLIGVAAVRVAGGES